MHQVQNSFPIGVERVLFAAATDPAFRALLLSDRRGALEACPHELSETERAMLAAIPDDQLANAIDELDVRSANIKRRAVLAAVATSAAGLATLQVASGCGTGTRPEDDHIKDGGSSGDGGNNHDGGPPHQDADTPDSTPAADDQTSG